MPKKETKRQHYVPQTYLQKFGVKRKNHFLIAGVDKNNLEKFIFNNINSVCLEKDIYTLKGETEEQRQALETFYSENVEAYYNEVYNTLSDDRIIEISEEMHHKIIMTMITMMYRTTKWIHEHNELVDRVLERLFDLCKQTNKDYFVYDDDKRYSIKGKTLAEVQKEVKAAKKELNVLTQLEVALKLINIRKFDGIVVDKLSGDNQLFTSDNPVTLTNLEPGHIAPFDPENMIRLPLDSNHIITIMPHSLSDGSHRITRTAHGDTISKAKMIDNNSSQLGNCYKYIYGLKKSLVDYIDKKKDYEKPVAAEDVQQLNDLINQYNLLIKNK